MPELRAKRFHWDDESTHKLIASYVAIHKLPKRKTNQNVFDAVFEDVFKGQETECTVSACRWKFKRLRNRYNAVRRGDAEKSGDFAKFYDELNEIYADEEVTQDQPRSELPQIMCRCCGQLDEDHTTIESSGEANLMDWFLAFTGLQPDTVRDAYTKICYICYSKLTEARKFREQCLMVEQVLAQEMPELPIKIEVEVDDEPVRKRVKRPKVGKQDRGAGSATKHDLAECVPCNQIFANHKELASHLRDHAKVEGYKCSVCDKTYSCSWGLTVHMATHDASLMRFQCVRCDEKFPTAVYLRYHMNRHTGTRPFVCKDCGKAYHRAHALNHHVRSKHLKVKYTCDECTDVYSRPTRLKLHVALAHRGAILRCSACDHESGHLSQFRTHLREEHINVGFNQSVHVKMANANAKLVPRRKLEETLIETVKPVRTYGRRKVV